ncbi:substrate-binding domain-containing protein [Kitasatospora sp. NPDC057541]|uniref:substrate-binding domain-containing protein n=1 Tax=unclassified Kitasatospora TaxID=2633591 RepID=UPI00367B7910
MRRGAWFGAAVALLVVGGLVFTVLKWIDSPDDPPTPPTPPVAKITGVVGSEKNAFFQDSGVKAALAAKGLDVSVASAGSWQMNDVKKESADFVFPASQLPADEVAHQNQVTGTLARPFYSPLVIVTHTDVANVLKENNLAKQDPGSKLWTFSMGEFLKAVGAGRRWDQLNATNRPSSLSGDIFLTTTNPETSSSGTLYIAMVAYLLNNKQVVKDQATVDAIAPALRDAINKQGSMKNSTEEPFNDFVSNNGHPLVLAYESQVLRLALDGTGSMPKDMVMLYPDVTITSDHTLVGFTPDGLKLGKVLTEEPKLRELEVKYGFRPTGSVAGTEEFAAEVRGLNGTPGTPGFTFAPDLGAAGIGLASVPRPEIMKSLVQAVKK